MSRKPEGPRALTGAERTASLRQKQATETKRLRMLLEEAVDTLRTLTIRQHTVPVSVHLPKQDIDICSLCGGWDQHTPACILLRAERARGWRRPMSSITARGGQRGTSVPARIVEIHGRWYGRWFDDHHGTGHHVVGPCATPEAAQQRARKDIQHRLGAHVRVIVETTH